MTLEKRRNPDWARQERQGDLEWVRENDDIFQFTATVAFQDTARGAIVVDTIVQPIPCGGHPFGYFDQESVKGELDEDTKRMVREYDPERELVLVLSKEENRTSTYRIKAKPSGA